MKKTANKSNLGSIFIFCLCTAICVIALSPSCIPFAIASDEVNFESYPVQPGDTITWTSARGFNDTTFENGTFSLTVDNYTTTEVWVTLSSELNAQWPENGITAPPFMWYDQTVKLTEKNGVDFLLVKTPDYMDNFQSHWEERLSEENQSKAEQLGGWEFDYSVWEYGVTYNYTGLNQTAGHWETDEYTPEGILKEYSTRHLFNGTYFWVSYTLQETSFEIPAFPLDSLAIYAPAAILIMIVWSKRKLPR